VTAARSLLFRSRCCGCSGGGGGGGARVNPRTGGIRVNRRSRVAGRRGGVRLTVFARAAGRRVTSHTCA